MSDALLTAYWKILKPFTDQECESAFNHLLRECKFFPKPSEFIELLQGKVVDRATVAWISVVETIRQVGPYRSVKFKDQTIHSVIEFMGGWPATGDWLEDELKWKEKEFERLYSVMKGREATCNHLPGILEIQGGVDCGRQPEPVFIGEGKDRKMIVSA